MTKAERITFREYMLFMSEDAIIGGKPESSKNNLRDISYGEFCQ